MALFSDNKRQLAQWGEGVTNFLATLRLTVHAGSAQTQPQCVLQGCYVHIILSSDANLVAFTGVANNL
ncbi:MAG: hypothetical protein R6X34_29225 [Chloroflexota bacterium]|jgi:hypothetical protein